MAALRGAGPRSRYFELVSTTASRSLKIRYRGSILGVYWSLSNPLLMTGLYTLIFGATFAAYYGHSIARYMLAVFTGLAMLSFFTAATTQALGSVVGASGLLNKVRLPLSIFPLGAIVANLVQLGIGTFPLLVAITLWRSHSLLNVFALLGPIAGLILTATGFGLALAALYVYFRDLPYLYELFVFVLSLTSPIFYPAAVVPQAVRAYVAFNPLAAIVESVRQIALSGAPPDTGAMLLPLGVGAVVCLLGLTIFMRLRGGFMDLL